MHTEHEYEFLLHFVTTAPTPIGLAALHIAKSVRPYCDTADEVVSAIVALLHALPEADRRTLVTALYEGHSEDTDCDDEVGCCGCYVTDDDRCEGCPYAADTDADETDDAAAVSVIIPDGTPDADVVDALYAALERYED